MTTLTAITILLHDMFEVSKVLIIAPKRVAEDTWSRETKKWDHTSYLTVSKVLGSEAQRRKALQKRADIYVINRENVPWLVDLYASKGIKWPFDMVVVDELSSFKSPSSQRFKKLRKVRPLIKRLVGLTGTPSPNSLLDLWSQMYLIDRGERLEATVSKYKARYFDQHPYQMYKLDLKPGAEESIYRKIDDVCVSMKAKDYLNLPERVNNIVKVYLGEKERALFKKLEREYILEFEQGDVVAATAAVVSNKLMQLSQGAVYNEHGEVQHIHDAKLDALEDIIEGAQGQPVLVFYSFKHDIARIQKRFKTAETLDADKAIERWNDGDIPLLLAHPASAGHGLNLQDGGHIIVWFGITWSLELYAQANARLDRQGQTQSVIVHHIITEDSIDERVMNVLEGKEEQQEALMSAVKARLEEYTREGIN